MFFSCGNAAFVKAVNDLLPDIINILGSEPDAEALVKAREHLLPALKCPLTANVKAL